MPFALIPDGFTLQKVTAAQERAVFSKRRQDDLIALINNPQTIAIIGTIIGGTLLGSQVDAIIESLKEEGVVVTDDIKEQTKQKVGKIITLNPFISLPGEIALGLAGKVDPEFEEKLMEFLRGNPDGETIGRSNL